MAWLRGIQVLVVPRREPRRDTRQVTADSSSSTSDTTCSGGLPEFPHPDSSSVRLRTQTSRASSPASQNSAATAKSDPLRVHKVQPKTSVYIPSDPGTQIAFQWLIDRPSEVPHQMYFILLINGRRVVSWGTDPKTTNHGITEYALFEPSDRWTFSEQGVLFKREGVEKRYFHFSPQLEGSSVAGDGGVFEVQVFRSKGRQKRAPEPGEYRDQEKYGIMCPSGGLVESPQDLSYFNWILIDPKDSPYATFRFYYRSWSSLKDLNLIPAFQPRGGASDMMDSQKENRPIASPQLDAVQRQFMFGDAEIADTLHTSGKGLKTPEATSDKRAISRKKSLSFTLGSPPERLRASSGGRVLPQPSKTTRDGADDPHARRPLPVVPCSADTSRRSSVSSRAASVTPSLMHYIDNVDSEDDEIDFFAGTAVALSKITPGKVQAMVINKDSRPLPDAPASSSPSNYGASPPSSDTSQVSTCVLPGRQEYPATSGNSLIEGFADLSTYTTQAQQATELSELETPALRNSVIPEGQWIKKSPNRRTPSPLRRKKTQKDLHLLAGSSSSGKTSGGQSSRKSENNIDEDCF